MPDIVFDEAAHIYTVDGTRRPNVTSILSVLHDWSGVPRETLEFAAHRGRMIHLAIELHTEGDLDESSLDPRIKPYINGYYRFLEQAKPEWLHSEHRVYHEQYKYCGTLDLHGILHGIKKAPEAVVDTKAVAKLMPATGVQTAAYAEALPRDGRKKPLERYALHLKKNETFVLQPYTKATDFPMFVSALNIYLWRQSHGLKEISSYE